MTREMTTIEDARRQWDERFARGGGTDSEKDEGEQERERKPEAVRVLYQQLHLTNGFLLGVTPAENDVIFTSADESGRSKVGGNVVLSDEDHPGNRYFLELLEAARKTYLTSVEGDELYWDVIHEVLKRGGRFLVDSYFAFQPFEVNGFLGVPQFDPLRDFDEQPAWRAPGPDPDDDARRGEAPGRARLERIMERRRLMEARGGGGGGGGRVMDENERIHQLELEERRMMRAMHMRQRMQRRNDGAEQQDDLTGLFHRNGNEDEKTPMNARWAKEICKDQLKNVANPYTSYACALELVQVVFSDEDKAKFEAWASTTPVLVPYEEDLSILSRYEPFRAMCNTVDSGLYPLQRAIRIGLEWDEGVKQIFEACDEIVRFPDPDDGLLPFQLAAATEDASVDLTYNLLKACPELVWQKLLNPNDMKYSPEFFTGYAIAQVPEEYLEQREKEEDIDWDNVEYEYTSTEESSGTFSCDEDSDDED